MSRISHSLIALFILALAGLTISPAAALYSEPCWIKFRIENSGSYRHHTPYQSYPRPSNVQSPVFRVTCNYLTGAELNARAGYRRFDARRVYAAIVSPYSDPIYIRISQSLPFCGEVTEPDCAERIAGRLTGYEDAYDRRGYVFRRTWYICQPGFIGRDCYTALGGYRDGAF